MFQVLDYSDRIRQLEDIPTLFEICATVLRWLQVHEKNIVCFNFLVYAPSALLCRWHSRFSLMSQPGERDYSALLASCYLLYSGFYESSTEALEILQQQRGLPIPESIENVVDKCVIAILSCRFSLSHRHTNSRVLFPLATLIYLETFFTMLYRMTNLSCSNAFVSTKCLNLMALSQKLSLTC